MKDHVSIWEQLVRTTDKSSRRRPLQTDALLYQPPFDRSSLTRWRQRMGEERLVALVQESLAVATRTGAAKPSECGPARSDPGERAARPLRPRHGQAVVAEHDRTVRQ